MKEYIAKLNSAQSAVTAATSKIADLTSKADTLRGSLETLRITAAEKAAAKDRVLDEFVRGDAVQGDVDRARDACDNAEKAHKESVNLVGATDRVLKKMKRDIPELENKVVAADRALWRAVADRSREKIIKAVGDEVWRLYAARGLSGPVSFPMFFIDLFGSLDHERIQAINKELRREVFGQPK